MLLCSALCPVLFASYLDGGHFVTVLYILQLRMCFPCHMSNSVSDGECGIPLSSSSFKHPWINWFKYVMIPQFSNQNEICCMVWAVNDRLAPVQLYLASESPLISIIEARPAVLHTAIEHCSAACRHSLGGNTHALDLGPVQPNIRNTATRDTWHVAQLTPGQCWSPHTVQSPGPRVKMSRTASTAARPETGARVWSLE